jgi:hypothetical protein
VRGAGSGRTLLPAHVRTRARAFLWVEGHAERFRGPRTPSGETKPSAKSGCSVWKTRTVEVSASTWAAPPILQSIASPSTRLGSFQIVAG